MKDSHSSQLENLIHFMR